MKLTELIFELIKQLGTVPADTEVLLSIKEGDVFYVAGRGTIKVSADTGSVFVEGRITDEKSLTGQV